MKVFSIYDNKANAHVRIFTCGEVGEAERIFMQMVKDERTQVSQFPEDFSLHLIGQYEQSVGQLEPLQHVNLGLASKYKKNVLQSAPELA